MVALSVQQSVRSAWMFALCAAVSACSSNDSGANGASGESGACAAATRAWTARFQNGQANGIATSGTAAALDADDSLFVGGYFGGSLDVAGTVLASDTASGFVARLADASSVAWAHALVGARVRAVAHDLEGGVIVAGTCAPTTTQSAFIACSDTAMYVARFDKAGEVSWVTAVVGEGGGAVYADEMKLAVASDQTIALSASIYDAYEQRDIALYELGPAGDISWSKRWGAEQDENVSGVAIDPDGNVIIAGFTHGGVDFGSGVTASGLFVTKLAPSGDVLFDKRFGDAPSWASVDALTLDARGGILIGGAYQGDVDFGDGPLLHAETSYTSMFIARLDATGTATWSRAVDGSAGTIHVESVVATPCGAAAVGELQGSASFGGDALTASEFEVFAWNVSAAGEPRAAVLLEDLKGYAHGAAVSPAGDVYLVGEYQPSEFAPDPSVEPGMKVMRQDPFAAKLAR